MAATLKRIRKELAEWEREGTPSGLVKKWAGERDFWVLHPAADEFSRLVELRPGRGPFQGGQMIWRLTFPKDYPFNHPTMHLISFGAELEFAKACVGMAVTLNSTSPEAHTTVRRQGEIVAKSLDRITICWSKSKTDDDDDDDDGPPELSDVDKEWWEHSALPALADATIFHPFINTTICFCGLRDEWSPANSFAAALAFVRVAVEDTTLDELKAVPAGSDNMRCFCTLVPEAMKSLNEDAAKWFRLARERFFGGLGIVPLCLSVSQQDSDNAEIECRSMAGENLAKFSMCHKYSSLSDLVDKIHENVVLPDSTASWKPVLPDGRSVDDFHSSTALCEVLGLRA